MKKIRTVSEKNCFWRDCWEMMPVQRKICHNSFRRAEAELKKYTDWRMSEWVASVAYQIKTEKKLLLIYNVLHEEDLTLNSEEVPADWVITTDRRYFHQADAVVFHLQSLYHVLENDLNKSEGQVWVSLYQESEKDNPLINDPEIREFFDLWMCYKEDANKAHPLAVLCNDVAALIKK